MPSLFSLILTVLNYSSILSISSYLFIVCRNFSCVCGDTWASELGILSTDVPRLITSFGCSLRVPRGTNGGVSLWGLLCSFLGGLCMGITLWIGQGISYFLYNPSTNVSVTVPGSCSLTNQLYLIVLGSIVGLLGSLIDSVLGATVQRTWYYPLTGKVSCYPPNVTETMDRSSTGGSSSSHSTSSFVSSYIRIPYSTDMLNTQVWLKKHDEYSRKNSPMPYVIITGYPILSNELVNLSSSFLTAGITVYFGYLYHQYV